MMRSSRFLVGGFALLLPITGGAAPKPKKPTSSRSTPSDAPPKVPTIKPPAKPFQPGTRPSPPTPTRPPIDRGTVYQRPATVKGDPSCQRGAADCNPCTPNVAQQFAKMRRKESKWKRKPWRFRWGSQYAPDGLRPYEAFDADTDLANALGLSKAHPQAFIRTNEGPAWYAGTHSQKEDGRPGTVFIIEQDSRGRKRLAALHQTKTQHPNGLHILGRYLLFAERPSSRNPDELRIIDLGQRSERQDVTHLVPEAVGESRDLKQFGGGLGAARLGDGSYLLISTVPGGRKQTTRDGAPQHRYHQFYNLRGDLSSPQALSMRFLGEQRVTPTATVPRKYAFSENLSVVTECGTGDIYTVHSSGDEAGLDGLEGRGYFRLSKLVLEDGSPSLRPLDVFEVSQTARSCHMRSAASVGVGPNGKLEFLCHQYRKDPDPSALNPFGGNISGRDHWNFRAGTPKD